MRRQASDCMRCLEFLVQRLFIEGGIQLRPGRNSLILQPTWLINRSAWGTVAVLYERADIGAAVERINK